MRYGDASVGGHAGQGASFSSISSRSVAPLMFLLAVSLPDKKLSVAHLTFAGMFSICSNRAYRRDHVHSNNCDQARTDRCIFVADTAAECCLPAAVFPLFRRCYPAVFVMPKHANR